MNLTQFQKESVRIGRVIAIIATFLIGILIPFHIPFGYTVLAGILLYILTATIGSALVHWLRINRRENQILRLTEYPHDD